MDLHGAVYFISLFVVQLRAFRIFLDVFMAIHTNIHRRYGSRFTFPGIAMAVKTADLVDTGMHFMRIEDWLFRLHPFLSLKTDRALGDIITTDDKKDHGNHGYINLIAIKRNRLGTMNTFSVI